MSEEELFVPLDKLPETAIEHKAPSQASEARRHLDMMKEFTGKWFPIKKSVTKGPKAKKETIGGNIRAMSRMVAEDSKNQTFEWILEQKDDSNDPQKAYVRVVKKEKKTSGKK